MPNFYTDLFGDSVREHKAQAFIDLEVALYANESQAVESILSSLSFKVSKKPKDLMAHLHRIYFCYSNQLVEPLYAAILDLLLILKGKGRKLSRRLIAGSRTLLDLAQISALDRAVDYPNTLDGNRYSLFTQGIVGTANLVEVVQKEMEQHDYMKLADDFIEYSQLDEAMSILELGLENFPERQDLQAALVELYRSTNSRERFNNIYKHFKASGIAIIDDWHALDDFFDGKTT